MRKIRWHRSLAVMLLLAMVFTMSVHADGTDGLVAEDGVTRIYAKGKMLKNVPAYKIKVNGATCFYTIDQNGSATMLTGLMATAASRLVQLKAGDKKSTQNLKKAFKWSASLTYRSNTKRNLKGDKAAEYYGKYGFSTRSGDCNTVAYTFYWMAKVLGYNPVVVQGHVPSGSMSNLKPHTWVTMKSKKKTYYYDPDLNRTYAGKTVMTGSGRKTLGKYCGFQFLYGTSGTYKYMK